MAAYNVPSGRVVTFNGTVLLPTQLKFLFFFLVFAGIFCFGTFLALFLLSLLIAHRHSAVRRSIRFYQYVLCLNNNRNCLKLNLSTMTDLVVALV